MRHINDIIKQLQEEGFNTKLNNTSVHLEKDGRSCIIYGQVQSMVVNNQTYTSGILYPIEYDLTDGKTCMDIPDWLIDIIADREILNWN